MFHKTAFTKSRLRLTQKELSIIFLDQAEPQLQGRVLSHSKAVTCTKNCIVLGRQWNVEGVLNKDGYVDLSSFVFFIYGSEKQSTIPTHYIPFCNAKTFLMAHLYIHTYTYVAMKEVNEELFHVSSVSVFMQI